MNFRLSPKNLCMSDGMPFQQHHEAQIFGRDLNDVLTEELLLNVRSNIKAGDEIMVCGYADQSANRLTQFARLRVYSSGKDGVKFVVAAPQRYKGRTYAIEPDASNATYFLAAGALTGGSVTVMGLGTASLQGDCEFAAVLARMGCRVERTPDCIKVSAPPSGHRLKGIDVDLNAMPDTVQTLAVVALFAEGPTVIRNVGNLRVKETDRLSALRTELTKLGATVEERSDGLTISPPQRITPATIDTYLDHRMAMSFALAGLMCAGIAIKDPRCCSKTMPDFFQRWERMVARTA